MHGSESPDHYEALQVSRSAQPLMISRAYRLLAAFYHPDNKGTGDEARFREVVEAYRVLSDPVRRAHHDRERFGAASAEAAAGGAALREPGERRFVDERELRQQILRALYDTRRSQPHKPGLALMVFPELFGCTIDEAQFSLWYLRGKKLIEITQDDAIAITVAGVDHVEGLEAEQPPGAPPALRGANRELQSRSPDAPARDHPDR
jgi:curved DNA-binding protein CbpA